MPIHIPVLGRLSLADYLRVFFAYAFLFCEPLLRLVFAILPLRYITDLVRKRLALMFGPKQEDDEAARLSKRVEQTFLNLHTTEEFASYW